MILLLTGSIQGTKNSVGKFLEGFTSYSWLWTKKPEDDLKKFRQEEPELGRSRGREEPGAQEGVGVPE